MFGLSTRDPQRDRRRAADPQVPRQRRGQEHLPPGYRRVRSTTRPAPRRSDGSSTIVASVPGRRGPRPQRAVPRRATPAARTRRARARSDSSTHLSGLPLDGRLRLAHDAVVQALQPVVEPAVQRGHPLRAAEVERVDVALLAEPDLARHAALGASASHHCAKCLVSTFRSLMPCTTNTLALDLARVGHEVALGPEGVVVAGGVVRAGEQRVAQRLAHLRRPAVDVAGQPARARRRRCRARRCRGSSRTSWRSRRSARSSPGPRRRWRPRRWRPSRPTTCRSCRPCRWSSPPAAGVPSA